MRGPHARPRRVVPRGTSPRPSVEEPHDGASDGGNDVPPGTRSGRPARPRARRPRLLAGQRRLRAQPGAVRGPPRVGLLRGSAHRQRHAGRPPHRGPRLQGRLPPLPDHEGLSTSPARPAGTATACRSSSPSRRSSGFTGKQDIEAYGIAEFNARCRESVTRHTDAFARLTERMGYWVDLDDAYRTMDSGLHRVGVVVAQADLRQGPAGRGLPGRAVVPALRDRPVRPRAGPGVRDTSSTRRSTCGSRSPRARWPAGRRCWSGRPPRGRWCPTRPSRCTRTSRTWSRPTATSSSWSPSRCWSRCSARAGRPPASRSPARSSSAGPTTAPFDLVEIEDAHFVILANYVTTDERLGPRAPGAGVRRRRPRQQPRRTACRWSTRSGRTARSSRSCRWSAACSSRRRTRRSSRTSPSVACSSSTSRTSTATRTAGAATPCWSTTPSRPGTSAPPRSATRCCARTSAPTGSRRRSSTGGTATG